MSRNKVVSHKVTEASVVGYTPPPRFDGVVKAVENKNEGRDYTKIGNLDTI
jgi:hypothetical protein